MKRTHEQTLIPSNLHEGNTETEQYPWWYVLGAFMYINWSMAKWAGGKIPEKKNDEKRRSGWWKCLRIFSVMNLSCSGKSPVGFTPNHLRHTMNKLLSLSLEEAKKCLNCTSGDQFFLSENHRKVGRENYHVHPLTFIDIRTTGLHPFPHPRQVVQHNPDRGTFA